MFRSTLPHGERHGANDFEASPSAFRSTLPHGERRAAGGGASVRRCFDPRSRTGSDYPSSRSSDALQVSIHAPARGATHRHGLLAAHALVSIHAPARGATRHRGAPTRSEAVSIHAPARGATRCRHIQARQDAVSIHAPARGATEDHFNHASGPAVFRSTLPHGERGSKPGG